MSTGSRWLWNTTPPSPFLPQLTLMLGLLPVLFSHTLSLISFFKLLYSTARDSQAQAIHEARASSHTVCNIFGCKSAVHFKVCGGGTSISLRALRVLADACDFGYHAAGFWPPYRLVTALLKSLSGFTWLKAKYHDIVSLSEGEDISAILMI